MLVFFFVYLSLYMLLFFFISSILSFFFPIIMDYCQISTTLTGAKTPYPIYTFVSQQQITPKKKIFSLWESLFKDFLKLFILIILIRSTKRNHKRCLVKILFHAFSTTKMIHSIYQSHKKSLYKEFFFAKSDSFWFSNIGLKISLQVFWAIMR